MGLKEEAYDRFFNIIYPLYRILAKRTMDLPPLPEGHAVFVVTVKNIETLTPHLKRFTLYAPELTVYEPMAPDEYFGLLLPPPRGLHLCSLKQKVSI